MDILWRGRDPGGGCSLSYRTRKGATIRFRLGLAGLLLVQKKHTTYTSYTKRKPQKVWNKEGACWGGGEAGVAGK